MYYKVMRAYIQDIKFLDIAKMYNLDLTTVVEIISSARAMSVN